MADAPSAIDPDRLKEYAKNVFGALGGAMTAAMIHLGDRLGLYRHLADGEPWTSAGLAARAGLDERWVREWLRQQGAAGVLEHRGDGRFVLPPEGRAVLADEGHPACGIGFFDNLPQLMALLEPLLSAFRTGIGLPYDAMGDAGARGIERGLAPWFRALLVPLVIPRLGDVGPRLERGAQAADVGCGGAVALLSLARAYPQSRFHGYELSRHALDRAHANRAEAGLANVALHDVSQEPLPEDARFDYVQTIDCLHDMTDPAEMARRIRRAIRDDGTWLVSDIKCHASYQENVERNPMAPMMSSPACPRRSPSRAGPDSARSGCIPGCWRGSSVTPGSRASSRSTSAIP